MIEIFWILEYRSSTTLMTFVFVFDEIEHHQNDGPIHDRGCFPFVRTSPDECGPLQRQTKLEQEFVSPFPIQATIRH